MKTFLGLMATVVLGVVSEQHVLFDSTKSRPDWFKYPKDLKAGPKGDNKTLPHNCVCIINISLQGGCRLTLQTLKRGTTGKAIRSVMLVILMLTTGCGCLLLKGGSMTESL